MRKLVAFVALLPLASPRAGCAGAEGEPPPTKARGEATARDGVPIVVAMERFRQDHGLWPCDLADLSPKYLKPGQAEGWRLDWNPDGWWHLHAFMSFDQAVRYKPKGGVSGWVTTDGEYDRPLGVVQPPSPMSTLSREQVRRNALAEFQRRVESRPKELIHCKGLVSFLYRGKLTKEARQACALAWRRWPGHWWTNWMLSKLDAELGDAAAAEARMGEWAEAGEDYSRHYLFAQFLFDCGKHKEARRVLLRAAKFDPVTHFVRDTGEVLAPGPAQYLWPGAMLAYREGWYDVARAVCDRWARYPKAARIATDPSYGSVLAATLLAEGKFDEARKAMDKTIQDYGGREFGRDANFGPLEAAIERKDTSFRHETKGRLSQPPPLLIEFE